MMASDTEYEVVELGINNPEQVETELTTGEVGYLC